MVAQVFVKIMEDERRAAQSRRPVGPAPMPELDDRTKINAAANAIRAEVAKFDPLVEEAARDVAAAQAVLDRATAAEEAAQDRQQAGEFVSSAALRKLTDVKADAAEKLRIEFVAKTAADELQHGVALKLIMVAKQAVWLSAWCAFERCAIATERKQIALNDYENAVDTLEIRRASLAEPFHSWHQADALLARTA